MKTFDSCRKSVAWLVVLSLFAVFGSVRADDPDIMVRFICDKTNRQLHVETWLAQFPSDAPYPRKIGARDHVFSTRGLMWAVPGETEKQDRWVSRRLTRSCTMGRDRYVIEFSPWRTGGAGPPSVDLSLWLNGKPVSETYRLQEPYDARGEHLKSLTVFAKAGRIRLNYYGRWKRDYGDEQQTRAAYVRLRR